MTVINFTRSVISLSSDLLYTKNNKPYNWASAKRRKLVQSSIFSCTTWRRALLYIPYTTTPDKVERGTRQRATFRCREKVYEREREGERQWGDPRWEFHYRPTIYTGLLRAPLPLLPSSRVWKDERGGSARPFSLDSSSRWQTWRNLIFALPFCMDVFLLMFRRCALYISWVAAGKFLVRLKFRGCVRLYYTGCT